MKSTLNTNESGFTLLESLVALMLSSIILLLLTATLSQLHQVKQQVIQEAQTLPTAESKIYGSRQIEWHLFLAQLENYLEGSRIVSHQSNEIIVLEKLNGQEQTVRYGLATSGNRNFYRRHNNGYNELLTNIKNIQISITENWMTILCTFQNDEQFEGRLWLNDWQAENKTS